MMMMMMVMVTTMMMKMVMKMVMKAGLELVPSRQDSVIDTETALYL